MGEKSQIHVTDILAKEIWTYCIDMDIWLLAVHIPRKENNTADYMSKLLDENTEWRLFPTIFKKSVTHFCIIFVTNLFYILPKFSGS